jgi:hypothetical protein
MPSTRAEVPDLAIPLRFTAAGQEVVVEQGSDEELLQSVTVAARVMRGSMDHDPELGTSDQTFREGGPETERLRAELQASTDRRADAQIDSTMDDAQAIVTIRAQRGER